MNELDSLVESATQLFAQSATPADLENAKAQFLGKSGRVTELMKGMAQLSVEEKKSRGAAINVAKQAIEAALTARRQALADAELQLQLKAEALDVSLPGRQRGQGGLHPVSLTLERIQGIFGSMGFDVAEGPEIETDWFNFTALNTPEDHPARSMQDTFYVDMKDEAGRPLCLRPHTSPMQVRAMEATPPPLFMIVPGKTYRRDSDATHSPMFSQIEGLVVDRGGTHASWAAAFEGASDDEARRGHELVLLSLAGATAGDGAPAAPRRLTSNEVADVRPRFAGPDQRWIVFESTRTAAEDLPAVTTLRGETRVVRFVGPAT